MNDGSTFWSIIGGLGIIFLWVRLYIAFIRIEKNTKVSADAAMARLEMDRERAKREEWARSIQRQQA